jgi:hypothetical protein
MRNQTDHLGTSMISVQVPVHVPKCSAGGDVGESYAEALVREYVCVQRRRKSNMATQAVKQAVETEVHLFMQSKRCSVRDVRSILQRKSENAISRRH